MRIALMNLGMASERDEYYNAQGVTNTYIYDPYIQKYHTYRRKTYIHTPTYLHTHQNTRTEAIKRHLLSEWKENPSHSPRRGVWLVFERTRGRWWRGGDGLGTSVCCCHTCWGRGDAWPPLCNGWCAGVNILLTHTYTHIHIHTHTHTLKIPRSCIYFVS